MENRYYVSCGAFGGGQNDIEYYVADKDGTIIKRKLSEYDAEVLCEELNAKTD